MMVPVELREIQIVDDARREQIVVLGEREGKRVFPIVIGLTEAAAMDSAVRNQVHQRPLTHDLILNAISELGGRIIEVQVDDLRESTFYGKLAVENVAGKRVLVDSRPSDALVLAMKLRVPIFVADHVLDAVAEEPRNPTSAAE